MRGAGWGENGAFPTRGGAVCSRKRAEREKGEDELVDRKTYYENPS